MTSAGSIDELPRGFEDLRGKVFRQRYAVSEILSFGRCHVVYGAVDRKGAGQVLLRVMRPSVLRDRATVERFEQRVQAVRRGSSLRARPSIDAGEAKDGKLFLVCKRPPGRSLGEYVRGHANGRLPWEVVRPLLQGFVEVLRAAHERRIVHGGMMPDSFWIEEAEGSGAPVAYVVDLGANPEVRLERDVAEVSRTRMLVADMEFTAPETIGSGVYDERTDVYLLGLIAWFMLVGRPPFQGENHFQVAAQQTELAVPSMRGVVPGVPEEVEGLIGRMLAKWPGERLQTMGQVGAEVGRAGEGKVAAVGRVVARLGNVVAPVSVMPPGSMVASVLLKPPMTAMQPAVMPAAMRRPSLPVAMPADAIGLLVSFHKDMSIYPSEMMVLETREIAAPVLEPTQAFPAEESAEVTIAWSRPHDLQLAESTTPSDPPIRSGSTEVISYADLETSLGAPAARVVSMPLFYLQAPKASATPAWPARDHSHGTAPSAGYESACAREPATDLTIPIAWVVLAFGVMIAVGAALGMWLAA